MKTVVALLVVSACSRLHAESPRWSLQRDDQSGQLSASVDGREVLTYQYSPQYALPHYWPLRSPSGKLLTVQHPDPYPHHQSLWIADKIKTSAGDEVDFYHYWKNYKNRDDPTAGFRHFIRHLDFVALEANGATANVQTKLQWVINETTPVVEESRSLWLIGLSDGEYLLDLAWELKPAAASVTFTSDAVHYAWPYVRVHPQFSGQNGGVITNDRGNQGQSATDGKVARWIDYSNTVDGKTEGLAIFQCPDDAPHKWLTREYGCFGPRRPDDLSGTGFTLKSSESLTGRVGILVHRGNVSSGRVADRYRQYHNGTLSP
jgi:hypothetical protein